MNEKTVLTLENRAWEKADVKRLVSNRVDLPHELVHQFPYATSAVFEVGYHHVLDGYTIQVYGYSAREKIKGKPDPCYGGLVKVHHDVKEPLVFPDKKKGLSHVTEWLEDKYGFKVII